MRHWGASDAFTQTCLNQSAYQARPINSRSTSLASTSLQPGSRFFPQVEWSWTIQVLVLPCTHIWRIGSAKAIPNFERCNRRVLHLVQQILAIAEPLNWRRIDVTCSIFCSATDCRIKQIQNQVSSARVDWQNVMEHRFRSISFTSSTAQSGGGSFINQKPIGEVGCCESRMAERIHWWTDRWLQLCFLEWLQWLQWCSAVWMK